MRKIIALLTVLTVVFGSCTWIRAASEESAGDNIIDLLIELTDEESVEVLSEMAEKFLQMDKTETMNSLSAIRRVITSDAFTDLASHEEFVDLVVFLVKRAAGFVDSNPQMTEEILVALGLDQKYAAQAVPLLRTGILSADVLNEKCLEATGMSLDQYGLTFAGSSGFQDVLKLLKQMDVIMENYAPDGNAAESSAESAAESVAESAAEAA